jgi:hypothetical protein
LKKIKGLRDDNKILKEEYKNITRQWRYKKKIDKMLEGVNKKILKIDTVRYNDKNANPVEKSDKLKV